MGAGSHLGIDLAEYDARIRTFIPGYERMLATAAGAVRTMVRRRLPLILDLGIGTGALAARCLDELASARVIGVDADAGMLTAARARLGDRLQAAVHGSFESIDLPKCDAIVSSLALHHIPTVARRRRLFGRLHRALRPGGLLVSADCYPASSAHLAADDRADWLGHLEKTYRSAAARRYLRTWAREDHYAPLTDEIITLRQAGFTVDVVRRRHAFAVIVAAK